MAISKVVVVDGNNLIVQIDRGVAGRGVTNVQPVEIDNSLYLVFTFSDGTTQTVGPVGTIQYIGQSPIVVTGSTISLSTVPLNLGGTGQTTANAGFNALAPSQTSNSGKYLKTDGTNTSWDLLDISTGDITGTLPVTNGGTGATTASGARTNLGLGTASTLNAGVALGVATLDAGGTVPLSQIPASIQGGVSYQGSWNASTNTPTLTSSVGSKGYYYVVSVAGSTNLNGVTDWLPGDWAIFNGTAWQKIDNTDAVASVNGYTGVVVLTAADVGAPPTTRTISAGTGLSGGGDLSANRTISLANTAVTAGSYGSASKTLTATVNAQGQLTALADTNIAIANTQVSGLGTMSTQNASSVAITGGSITGITDLAIADGGTGQSTANAAFNALAPTQTGNSGKYLTTDGSNTSWAVNPLGTVTSVDASGGTTGLSFSGGPVTTSGTLTLAGTLAVANGGTGVTSSTGTGSVVLSTSPTLVTPLLGTPTSGDFSTGTFTWPTFNQNTTGTAANITATTNSTLTTLSSLSLPGSQVSGNIAGNSANVTGTVAITNGGTGQTTANAAFNALAPSQTSNSGKYLTTDGTNTSWATNPLGTVTSVGGTGTISGISLSGTVTTSGNLTLGGALDLSAYNGAGAFTTLSASSTVTLSGGTANGVAYLNGSKVLTTGSALTFDGTTFTAAADANRSLQITQYGTFSMRVQNPSADSGATIDYKTAGVHSWTLGSSEQMRLTSTGLGIGTSSPTERLHVAGALRVTGAQTTAGTGVYLDQTSGTGGVSVYGPDNSTQGTFRIYTATANGGTGSTKLTIDSSGNLLVGATSAFNACKVGISADITAFNILSIRNSSAGTGTYVGFLNSSDSTVGSISYNGTATLYNTTSDQRLKENIVNADSASLLIDSLQVRKFNWKADGSHQRYGFIAQELATVAPEAVHQPADPEEMMAVDYSKLVPMLVKEIQSLRARVAQLESN